MSTTTYVFYEEKSKLSLNYHQISSNMHLISSAETDVFEITSNKYFAVSSTLVCKSNYGNQCVTNNSFGFASSENADQP